MPTLSSDQISSLAKEFTQFGATISDFLNNNAVGDDIYASLSRSAAQCAQIGTNLTIETAQTDFADSAGAFKSLLGVTTDANHAADTLNSQIQKLSRVAKIAAGMIALGTSIGSGNVKNVTDAIGNLHKEIWG